MSCSSRRLLTPLLVTIFLLLTATAAYGQSNATVTGLVQDATGAVVPGAELTLTNVDQNRPWKTSSNEVGAYVFQQIPPGSYKLEATAAGFKNFSRTGLILRVAQVAEIDISLELGAVTETVEVSAEAPLLDTASSTLGEVVNSLTTENLPLNGRNVLQLVLLTPGVNPMRNSRNAGVGSGSISAIAFSANGGRVASNMIMLDGSPQEVMGYNQPAYIPSPDAVQEFKVQTNNLSAEYGRTGGAVVNIVHRSGTSEFHGVLYEFLRNDKLDANGFFNNLNGKDKAAFRYNQFGGTMGGPLTPSRANTFFFFNYEGIRRVNPGSSTMTVPTELMKQGNFTQISDIIYDPATINGAGIRQPFAGQIIPASRQSAIAKNILESYPTPTREGVTNNFFSTAGSDTGSDNVSVKIDRRISDRQNLFGRFSWNDSTTNTADHFKTPGSPNTGWSGARNRSVTLDDTYIFKGWILHGNIGYGYHANPRDTIHGVTLASLGFNPDLDNYTQFKIYPRINPSGYNQLGSNGGWIIGNKFETWTFAGDASKLIGNHTVKFGGSYRRNTVSNFRPFDPGSRYTFNDNWTRRAFNKAGGGDTMADLLLGLPSGGLMREEPALSLLVPYGSLYVQDDWRVNTKLTVNIGLRWEADWPLTERYDRASSWCSDCPLPLEVEGYGTFYGGIRFAGDRSTPTAPRGVSNLEWKNFAPRLGIAYKLTDKLVIRTGFGVFFNPMTGRGPNTTQAGALSFNSITNISRSIDGGRTPYATLENPWPDGILRPANGANGLMTFVGQGITANFRDNRMGYSMQWNFNIQYELGEDMLFDIAYAGNSGVKLMVNPSQLNQLPDEDMSLGAELTKKVDNPFFGILDPATPMGKKTTTLGQLLRPYPHLTGLNAQWQPLGHSSYHALQTKFRKRFSHGIQFLVAYTFSKTLDDISSVAGSWLGQENPSYINHNQRWWNKSLSGAHIPHSLTFNYQWDLPFGQGRRWLSSSGVSNVLVGGWSINGITTYQSGLPSAVRSRSNTLNNFGGTQTPMSTGISAETSGSNKDRWRQWFNPAAFETAPAYTYGNIGPFLPDANGPSYVKWDLSILKDFQLTERFRLQFRTELFNAFNNVNFRNPTGSALQHGRSNFGTISATEAARIMQFGLKLYY